MLFSFRQICITVFLFSLTVSLFCAAQERLFAKHPPPVITVKPPQAGSKPPTASLQRQRQRSINIINTSIQPLEAEMVFIEGGPCWIGSNWADTMCGPARKVSLPPFYIDKYEVTNEMWLRFVQATGQKAPEYWKMRKQIPDFAKLPVFNVSWYEATAYARWAGKRLPTEEEWEKAARGPDGLIFPWGHLFVEPRANTWTTGIGHPTPVGSFPKGASVYGAHDMLGNALEWTSSSFAPYPGSRFKPSSIVPQAKVLKGVSWKYEARPLFNRYPAPAWWRRWNEDTLKKSISGMELIGIIGFRCAKDGKEEI